MVIGHMRSYLEIAYVSSTSSFTQLPLADILPGKKAWRAWRGRSASFGHEPLFWDFFNTGSLSDRNRGPGTSVPSRARTSRDSRQPTADEDRGRQLDFCPPALIHFSTHTRKVKMAALTVSFAGKIGATAPRVANARAAGEFPSAPRAPDASAPPSRPAKSPPFRPRSRERRLLGVPSSHPARGRATTRTSSTRRGVPNASFVDPRAAIVSPAVSRSMRPRPDRHPGCCTAATLAPERKKTQGHPTRGRRDPRRYPRLDEGADASERRFRPQRTTTDSRSRSPPSPTPRPRRRGARRSRNPSRVKSASARVASPATPFASPRPPPRRPSASSSWSTTSPRTTPPSPRPGRSP